MRKQLFNECRLTIDLKVPPETRLIVAAADREKQQRPGQNEESGITVPVLDRKENGRPYLPGSSVKGVFRSRAEYIANLINDSLGTCHLFAPQLRERLTNDGELDAFRRMPCGHRLSVRVKAAEELGQPLPESIRYRDACPACQLFGHTLWAGRLGVTDFTLTDDSKPALPEYPHIAIDRITSGVADNKLFQMRYVTNATFRGVITVENFSLWQLGWLGFLIQDLRDGLIAIGHKRTSGVGRVKLVGLNVELRSIYQPTHGEVWGIGRYLSANACRIYGYDGETQSMSVGGLTWIRKPASIWYMARPRGQDRFTILNDAGRLTNQRLHDFAFTSEMLPEAINALLPGKTSAEGDQ